MPICARDGDVEQPPCDGFCDEACDNFRVRVVVVAAVVLVLVDVYDVDGGVGVDVVVVAVVVPVAELYDENDIVGFLVLVYSAMFSFGVAVAGLGLHRDQELPTSKRSCSSGFDNFDAFPLDDTLCSRNVDDDDVVVVVAVAVVVVVVVADVVIGGFEVEE